MGGIPGKATHKIPLVAPLIRTNESICFGHHIPKFPSREVWASGLTSAAICLSRTPWVSKWECDSEYGAGQWEAGGAEVWGETEVQRTSHVRAFGR